MEGFGLNYYYLYIEKPGINIRTLDDQLEIAIIIIHYTLFINTYDKGMTGGDMRYQGKIKH